MEGGPKFLNSPPPPNQISPDFPGPNNIIEITKEYT
jgi:hypothetical protein